jgi:type I restriction enzyme S subunit
MAKYKAYPEYKDSGVEWLGNIPPTGRLHHYQSCLCIKQAEMYSKVSLARFVRMTTLILFIQMLMMNSQYMGIPKANYQSNTITVSGRGDVGFAVYRNHAYDAIIRLLVLAPLKRLECNFTILLTL